VNLRPGHPIRYQGRIGNITEVGTLRRDAQGRPWQSLTVTTYAGSWIIASDHPDLEVLGQ